MPDEEETLGFVHVLSSGEYSDYRVHCAFADEADAARAAAEMEKCDRYEGYFAEKLPLMPAGRMPRRVLAYRCIVSTFVVEHRDEELKVYDHATVWEWDENAVDLREAFPHKGRSILADFIGTDRDKVLAAGKARRAEIIAAKEAGTL